YLSLHHIEAGLKDTAAASIAIRKAYHIATTELEGGADPRIFRTMGEHYYDTNKPDSALYLYNEHEKQLTASRRIKDHPGPGLLKAQAYLKLKDFKNAETLLSQAEKNPNLRSKEFISYDYLYQTLKYQSEKHRGNIGAALYALERKNELREKEREEEY